MRDDRQAIAPSAPWSTDRGGGLPTAPPGERLRAVRYCTCPEGDLRLFVAVDVSKGLDVHGVPGDAWWVVRCSGLPDRTIRLVRGSVSLASLLRRYAFQDADGCVNHKDVRFEYAPRDDPLPHHSIDHIPSRLRDATGVPQFSLNSGVCWYASFCWTAFASSVVKDMVCTRMPTALRPLCDACLHDRVAAEELRARLWHDYAVGDDVTKRPELDGRNGLTEFCVLCAKIGLPMIRYVENRGRIVPMQARVRDQRRESAVVHPPSGDEPHLLIVRFQDGDHKTKFPMPRRIRTKDGRRYRLVGFYMGQRKCGHQIGASLHDDACNWRHLSVTDADLHKDGVSPIFVFFKGEEWVQEWWAAMDKIVHVTKFGPGKREFCNMSPHNPKDDSLDNYRDGRYRDGTTSRDKHGSCSIDLIFAFTRGDSAPIV